MSDQPGKEHSTVAGEAQDFAIGASFEASVEKMQAARADDPAGFFAPLTERALDPLKRVPGFAEADADPARLAVSLDLQKASGVAQPRVLARAEAGELAAGLDALKPSERPAQIRTLEVRFGDAFAAARAELAANDGAMTGALTRVASTREIGKGGVSGGASRGGVSRGIGANVSPADPSTAGQLTAVQEIGPAEIGKGVPPQDNQGVLRQLTDAGLSVGDDNSQGPVTSDPDLTQQAMVVPVPGGKTGPGTGMGPVPPGPLPPKATQELDRLFRNFGDSIGRILGIPSAAPDDDDGDDEQQNLPAKPGETTPAQPPEEEPPTPPRPPGPDLPLPDVGGGQQEREPGPKVQFNDRVSEVPFARRLLRRMPQRDKKEADSLVEKFQRGIRNPGIGTDGVDTHPGFFKLRHKNGARVIIADNGDGSFDIVGKYVAHRQGDSRDADTINRLIEEYKKIGE